MTTTNDFKNALHADEYAATLAEIKHVAEQQINTGPSFTDRHTLKEIVRLIFACNARIEES